MVSGKFGAAGMVRFVRRRHSSAARLIEAIEIMAFRHTRVNIGLYSPLHENREPTLQSVNRKVLGIGGHHDQSDLASNGFFQGYSRSVYMQRV
jgi:hypothetical protein